MRDKCNFKSFLNDLNAFEANFVEQFFIEQKFVETKSLAKMSIYGRLYTKNGQQLESFIANDIGT